MWKPFLLAVVLLCESPAGKQRYAGPNGLGPYRIDRDVLVRTLLGRLGRRVAPTSRPFSVCAISGSGPWPALTSPQGGRVAGWRVHGNHLGSTTMVVNHTGGKAGARGQGLGARD
jgi:hypothetical protein